MGGWVGDRVGGWLGNEYPPFTYVAPGPKRNLKPESHNSAGELIMI